MAINKPFLRSKNEYYLLGLLGLAVLLYLINTFLLPGNKDSMSRSLLVIPGVVLAMMGLGAVLNRFLSPPLDFGKAAKIGFYIYLFIAASAIIPYLFMVYGEK